MIYDKKLYDFVLCVFHKAKKYILKVEGRDNVVLAQVRAKQFFREFLDLLKKKN